MSDEFSKATAELVGEIYRILPPLGQALLSIFILIAGGLAAKWGWSKSKETPPIPAAVAEDPRLMPLWTMIGPVHEAIQAIHDMAEEARKGNEERSRTNVMLTELCKTATNLDRGQDFTHRLLEAILANQEMRDTMAHPAKAPLNRRKEPI